MAFLVWLPGEDKLGRQNFDANSFLFGFFKQTISIGLF